MNLQELRNDMRNLYEQFLISTLMDMLVKRMIKRARRICTAQGEVIDAKSNHLLMLRLESLVHNGHYEAQVEVARAITNPQECNNPNCEIHGDKKPAVAASTLKH